MYLLKKNVSPFEVTDGSMAGRRFEHGTTYTEIPAGEQERFEKQKPTRAKGKKEVTEDA